MSLKVPKANNIQLFKDGYKVRSRSCDVRGMRRSDCMGLIQQVSGLEDAVLRNIQAVAELSDLVRTSFGPNGALQ